MLRSACAFSLVVAGVTISFGCKLFKSSSDKACDRMEELFPESSKKTNARADCITELTKLKGEAPAEHDCMVRCLTESRNDEDAAVCLGGCKSSAATAKAKDKGDEATKRRRPTPSTS